MHPVPEYAQLNTDQEVNYLCCIKEDTDYNIKFYRDKLIVVIRNCDESGKLIDLKLSQAKMIEKPWVLLRVRDFKIDGRSYKVPVCHLCNDCTESMSEEQTHEKIASVVCIHCKISSNIIRNYNDCWTLDGALYLGPDDEDETVVEIFHKKDGASTRSQHLALVITKSKISLLYTTGRQCTPSCSMCTAPKCQCIRLWKKELEKTFSHSESPTDIPNAIPSHYRLQDKPYINKSDILFPLQRCELQTEIIKMKLNGTHSLPDEICPEYSENILCKHGNPFESSQLKLYSRNVILFHDKGETIVPTKIFCRQSTRCRCLQQPDTHSLGYFNIGIKKSFY